MLSRLAMLAIVGATEQQADPPCNLPGMIPKRQRSRIMVDNQEIPLGIVMATWASQKIASHMIKYVMEEIIGYETVFSAHAASSPTAYDFVDGSPGETAPENHIAWELWTSLFLYKVTDSKTRPEDFGSIGFEGSQGLFVHGGSAAQAFGQQGLALEFYKNLNVSWQDISRLCSSSASIQKSDMMPCNEVRSSETESWIWQEYVNITGDAAGIQIVDGKSIPKCREGPGDVWWPSPACRREPKKCITVVTGGNGWSFEIFMQKATRFDIPLLIGTARDYRRYATIIRKNKVFFYWWRPDPEFVEINPLEVVFPTHDRFAWDVGDKTSQSERDAIHKFAHYRFKNIASRAHSVLSRMEVSKGQVDWMLQDFVAGQALTPKRNEGEVACRWLQRNQATWQKWIPVSTDCALSFGIVDRNKSFVPSLENAESCRSCSPGRAYKKPQGASFSVCEECSPGRFSDVFQGLECFLCPVGRFSSTSGATACSFCDVGTVAEELGMLACEECPRNMTTLLQGAFSTIQHCVCPVGSSVRCLQNCTCMDCPKVGMNCPGGHPLGRFNTMVDRTPLVKPGFMVNSWARYDVYSCDEFTYDSNCEGDRDLYDDRRMCGAEDLANQPRCGICKDGYFSTFGSCKICPEDSMSKWKFAIPSFILITVAGLLYEIRSESSSGFVTVSLVLNFLQTSYVLLQMPLLWQNPMLSLRSALELIFSSKLVQELMLPVQCYIPQRKLSSKIAFQVTFPLLFVLALSIYGVGRYIVRRSFKPSSFANALGKATASLYVSMTRVTLELYPSTGMPCGVRMIRAYSNIQVYSEEWLESLPISIVALLVYCVLFLSIIAWAVWKAPVKACSDQTFMECFDFAFGDFFPDRWYWIIVVLLCDFSLNAIQVIVHYHENQIYLTMLQFLLLLICQHSIRPLKYAGPNNLAIYQHSAMLVLLVTALSFVDGSLMDPKERSVLLSYNNHLCFVAFISAMAAGMVTFMTWCVMLRYGEGRRRGWKIDSTVAFRDLAGLLVAMSNKDLKDRCLRLTDADVFRLESARWTIVAAMLQQQPGQHFLSQRLLPDGERDEGGNRIKAYDAAKIHKQFYDSVKRGELQKQALSNMRQTQQLERIRAALTDPAEQQVAHTDSSMMLRGMRRTMSAESAAQCLQLTEPKRRDEFIEVIGQHFAGILSDEDIGSLFDLIDDGDGVVEPKEFIQVIVGFARHGKGSVTTSLGEHLGEDAASGTGDSEADFFDDHPKTMIGSADDIECNLLNADETNDKPENTDFPTSVEWL